VSLGTSLRDLAPADATADRSRDKSLAFSDLPEGTHPTGADWGFCYTLLELVSHVSQGYSGNRWGRIFPVPN
jgi:hypothetical protein